MGRSGIQSEDLEMVVAVMFVLLVRTGVVRNVVKAGAGNNGFRVCSSETKPPLDALPRSWQEKKYNFC